MKNPFKYGEIVTGEDFADREKELKQLVNELMSEQNILLYSPRRYGKSSLMMMAIEELKKRDVLTAFVDVYGCISLSDLVDELVEKTVIPAYGKTDKVINFLRSQFSGVRAEVTLEPDGSLKISFRKEIQGAGESHVLSKVLDAPEKLASAKKKHLVVVFDEFQEIENLDARKLENLMRAHFQHHKNVTYVFMGSKRHIVEQMFGDPNRPFYRFAKPFPLGKIPVKEFGDFIVEKFRLTEVTVDESVVASVLAFTDGHPYLTQQLCHEIWNIGVERGSVEDDDIESAIAAILRIHDDLFVTKWDSLTTQQKKLLVAISNEDGVPAVYSMDFIRRYELNSPSHVERALETLLSDSTVEKVENRYIVTDIFFKEWIRSRG